MKSKWEEYTHYVHQTLKINHKFYDQVTKMILDYLHPDMELYCKLKNELDNIQKHRFYCTNDNKARCIHSLKTLIKKVLAIYTWKMYGSLKYSTNILFCLGNGPDDPDKHSNFEYKRIVHTSWPLSSDLVYWHRYAQSRLYECDFYHSRPALTRQEVDWINTNNSVSIANALLALNYIDRNHPQVINYRLVFRHIETLLMFQI